MQRSIGSQWQRLWLARPCSILDRPKLSPSHARTGRLQPRVSTSTSSRLLPPPRARGSANAVQADDLRPKPPHLHDMDTVQARRLPCPRRITFIHPSIDRFNRSRPSQCLEADLHRDVSEGERRNAWGPGRRSTYLVPRTVRLGMHSGDTLVRGEFPRTALKIAVNRYMPLRWSFPMHAVSHLVRCTPPPVRLGNALALLYFVLSSLSGARCSRGPPVLPEAYSNQAPLRCTHPEDP